MENKPGLLLHSCCGPCSTSVVERLKENYKVTLFYYNPNITDREEYEKRRDSQLEFLGRFNNTLDAASTIEIIEGEYDTDRFYAITKGLESEPEGGKRCIECFRLRLSRTFEESQKLGIYWFGTTLSVSPYKNHKAIRVIGNSIAEGSGLNFIEEDFKKKAGYQRSIQLAKEYELYRQNYCGCEYSK